MKRPTTGTLVLLVGLADLVFTAVLYASQLAAIGAHGVFGAVMFSGRASGDAAALWFAVKGAMLVVVGLLARSYEKIAGRLPQGPGWALATIGIAGAIIAPISGFWVYIALGGFWVYDARRR